MEKVGKKRWTKLLCLMAAIAVLVLLCVFLILRSTSKTRIYEETRFYGTEDGYYILLDENGTYQISDILFRRGKSVLYIGEYKIYDTLFSSRLVLTSYHGDRELVFRMKGEDWIFCASKSFGYEDLLVEFQDGSVWMLPSKFAHAVQ